MRVVRGTFAMLVVPGLLVGQKTGAAQTLAAAPYSFRGQVVVLRPPDVDQLTRTALARILGELTAARFEVAVFPLDAQRDPTPQVETVAPELRPVAAFAIAHSPGATDDNTIAIWVCDRLERRTTVQRMAVHRDNVSQDAEVLAVEAIELIRGSVAGLWPTRGLPSAEAANPPTRPAGGAPEVTIGLGVATLQDGALPSGQWMGSLTAMVRWPRGLALRGQLRGLGPSTTLSASSGAATVRRAAASGGVGWVFWSEERVRTILAVDLGAERLTAVGTASDTARAHTASAWSSVLSAGAAASFRLNNVLAFGVEIDGLLATPPTTLRIADTTTKQLSQPGLLITAALQARH